METMIKQFGVKDLFDLQPKSAEDQIHKLVDELYSKIPNKTYSDKALFTRINKILESCQINSNAKKENYETAFQEFQGIKNMYQSNYGKGTINNVKNVLKRSLEKLWSKEEDKNIKAITELITLIYAGCFSRLPENVKEDILCIVLKMFCLTDRFDDINKLEYMQDILSVNYKTRNYSRTDFKNIYDKKINQLRELLSNYDLSDKLHENYISYRANKKLKFAVEMLVLDILSILGDSHNILENNFLFFEESSPVLVGKSLRNHLAHDNFAVDVLENVELITFLNARKIVSENLMESRRLIGKISENSPENLKTQFYNGLHKIKIQQEMFGAMEAGKMDEFKNCLIKGAEIQGKDFQNSSALHFVCKSNNLSLLKFILNSHNFDAEKSCNNSGDNPLHIAASSQNTDKIVEYLVEKVGIDVNSTNKKRLTAIHIACSKGHSKVLKVLLKLNANTGMRDRVSFNAIHHAIAHNHYDILEILMENMSSVDFRDVKQGFSCLHLAADNGFLKMVEYLLEKGVDSNLNSDKGTSPLHCAAMNGHLECVERLVSAGANVNHVDIRGFSALHFSVDSNHYDVAKFLIDHGANVNLCDHTYKQSPIYYAAQKGHAPLIELLVKAKSPVNVSRCDNFTPLMFAIMNDHEEAVKELIKHGAKTQFGNVQISALHLVQANGNMNIVKLLVDNGVDVNVRDNEDQTPLHVFCMSEECYDAIKILIDLKADVNAEDFFGATPIFNAIKAGNKRVVELLIENNAEVATFQDVNGMTPLHAACSMSKKNMCEIIQIMIDQGCDVNRKTFAKTSPLHLCVTSRSLPAVELLINNRAQIDPNDGDGKTPLMLALESNQLQIARVLLENGANIRATEKHAGLLTMAVKQKNIDIVKLLLWKESNSNCFNYKEAFTQAIEIQNYKIFEFLLEKYRHFVGNFDSNTPHYLQMACSLDLKQFATDLIAKGYNVYVRDRFLSTSLHAAAKAGSYDCAQLLLDNGAIIDVQDAEGSTPLLIAATHGHVEVVKLLIEKGANVTLRDHRNRSALEVAVEKSHLDVIKVFFELKKFNLDEKGNESSNILHRASNSNDLEVFKYLANHGCDVHAVDDRGIKAIHHSAREGFTKIIEYLIKSKLSTVDDVCNSKFSLLHYAAAGNQLETAKFLIEHGANVNAVNSTLQSPLHIAAQQNFKSLVQLLLKNGAIYNINDINGKAPKALAKNGEIIKILSSTEKLFNATEQNNLEEVKLHIKNGGAVNAKNNDNLNCMHYACCKGFHDIVKVLLKNDGNPNVIGKDGFTPLHNASESSHYNIVITLLSNGAIFDVSSEAGKTPLDLAGNKSIKDILSLITKAFTAVTTGDTTTKDDICKIKARDVMRAVMSAKNLKGKTLIVEAMIHNYPKVDDLKSVMQDNPTAKMNFSRKLVTRGEYQESLKIMKALHEQRIEIFGEDNPAVDEVELLIAQITYKKGEFLKSLTMQEKLYEKFKIVLGPHHKQTLETRSGMALVMYRLGRNVEALKIFQAVYKKQKEMFGPLHSDTMSTYFHMAASLDHLGRLEESLYIFENVYETYLLALGEMDPMTIAAQNNCAMLLGNMKRTDEAVKMYRDVYRKKKIVFGENYVDTIKTLFNMASMKYQTGKYKDTLPTFYEILKQQSKVLGPYHPDTLNTQFTIGSMLTKEGKFIAAYKILQVCQERSKITFGFNHPFNMQITQILQAIEVKNMFTGDIANLKCVQQQFFTACSEGKLNLIKRFLEGGQEVDEVDEEGRNGLHFAVSGGHKEVVKFLLQSGIDTTVSSFKGNTALHTSCNKSLMEITEILIQHVKDKNRKKLNEFINFKTTSGETTALHLAAKNNSLNFIKILLKNGANYNLKNKNNQQPADMANNEEVKKFFILLDNIFNQVKSGNIEVLKKLDELSVEDFSIVTNARFNDMTVLQVAMWNKHKDIVKGLSEMLKSKI